MSTSTLRFVWPFLGPLLGLVAVAVGCLADQAADWLNEPMQTAAITNSLPLRPSPPRNAVANGPAQSTEGALFKQLEAVPEVSLLDDIDKEGQAQLKNELRGLRGDDAAQAKETSPRPAILPEQQRAWRESGLAVRTNEDCQLEPEAAELMQRLSRVLRSRGFVSLPGRDGRMDRPRYRCRRSGSFAPELLELAGHNPTSPAPTFVQMLQPEGEETRMALVEALNRVQGVLAATALARRAVFELSPQVRSRAVMILGEKPRDSYRQVLLDSFRHPWAPAAEHAADALIAVKDRDAIPALKELLNEPDPSAPVIQDGTPMVRELVRVNHLKNCLLCHAPSLASGDLVRGRVPSPDEPLPFVLEYYGDNERRRPSPDDIFVRADITYLRQDFSEMMPVPDAKPWPEMQRFDFLVRTRPATAEELAAQKVKKGRSPQRGALQRAIQALIKG